MSCLEVQNNETIDPQGWELFYSQIEGFKYQPGYLYRITVAISDREPPLPADVSAKTYELVEVLSKSPDPALRLPTSGQYNVSENSPSPRINTGNL